MIRINYAALRKDDAEKMEVPPDLLRKAKGMFGFGARRQLCELFAPHLRLQAMEVAQRQMNPQALMDAGVRGLLQALKAYDVDSNQQSFKEFATPFIRRAMVSAKSNTA